jgi:hypothetical protein
MIQTSSDLKAQVTCNASGNWSGTAGWVPAAPVAGDNVTVAVGCTLYVDIITVDINDLTINGVVIITNTAGSILKMQGNLIVNSAATLINNGALDFQVPGNNFNLNGTGTYVHNPFNNNVSDENVFVNANETFSTTSNLVIQKWFDGNVPLAGPTRIQTSIMGNVTLAANVSGGTWDQDGFFSVPSLNRIRGSLTVSSGTVVMDDGTGSTTSLILQDVTVNGTGNIVFQRGYNRNYSLQVNNFSVNSTAPAKPTVILDTCFGVMNMTINGSMNISHDFNAIYGHSYLSGADIRITVNGNLNISGGNVIFNNKASAALLLNVNGTTTLNNLSPGGMVCFVEGANGSLTLNTQDLLISGGNSNYLYGRPGIIPAVKGTATLNISNDFTINGTSTTYVAFSDTSVGKVRVSVGRDFTMNGSNSQLTGAYTNGAFTFKVSRNFTQTNGQFTGQAYKANLGIDSIITGGNFTFNSGNSADFFVGNKAAGNTFIVTSGNFSVLSSGTGYKQGVVGVDSSASNLSFIVSQNFIQNGGQFSGILSGSGIATFTVTGILDVNGGVCRIHNNSIYSNNGNINFSVGSIDFDGGVFSAFYSCNNSGLVGNFSVSGACNINFSNSGDIFSFIGLSVVGTDVNNLQLFLSIPSGITISGANGTFYSSNALGAEFITIGGLSISNGTNSFNGQPGVIATSGHYVSLTINGNLNVSGGNTYMSASSQTVLATISGDVNLSGGSLSIKGSGTTNSTVNILGAYNHTGGNFYMHNHLTDKMPEGSAITMTVNSNEDNVGDFTHTGGIFAFDNCSTTPASMNLTLQIKSPNYTLGGSGQMTMTNPGVGSVHGIINFARIGVINYNRSGSHDIQQVKQNILGSCTLDIVSGNMQLKSHNSAPIPPDALWIFTGGVLDLRTNKLFSNAVRANSGVSVFGRVRTQNVAGLYDGTINAAFSTTIADNFDFYIASSSTIEYYGVDNQVITGLGIGKAQSTQHKYGNLEINFGGTPDVEFVYPTNIPNDSAVMVKGNLLLTNGELNLDDDHDPTNLGGRWIVLENGSVSAMSRTSGYIRSESENGNGLVKWTFNSITGSHTFHFGYNSGNYIPFVFNHSSGSSATVYVSTYHTDPLNIPYPPTVTHVRDNNGLDNSANTVDRFWYIKTTGNIPSANLTFNCTSAETGTISNLVAQKWDLPFLAWNNPQGTQISLSNGVQANAISNYNNWWTLSGNSVLLPVELISFNGICDGKSMKLKWETATEVNNDFFSIEKSFDSESWFSIGTLSGSGNSSHIQSYFFNDPENNHGYIYYRLRQTDYDGSSRISQTIRLKACDKDRVTSVSLIQSDPGIAKLLVNSEHSGQYFIKIYQVDSKLIQIYPVHIDIGTNLIDIESQSTNSGIYFIQLYNSEATYNFKYLKAN